MPRSLLVVTVGIVLAGSGSALAQDAPAPAPPMDTKPAASQPGAAGSPAADASLGLAVDLGISTAYVFRGYNMFQTSSQWNQYPFVAPSITWSIPRVPGLSVGYWGAYQFAGPNIQEAMDAGIGAESDFLVTYTRAIVGDLAGGIGFTAYVYPAADKSAAGTSVPTYLEPALFASLPTAVDLGLKVAYFHGVQDAVSAYRYVYLNPTVGKNLVFNDRVSLALSGGLGYKLFIDRSTPTSDFNTVDVLLSVAVPFTLPRSFYVKPSVSWAWTNFPDRSAGNEMVLFGGVNAGASF